MAQQIYSIDYRPADYHGLPSIFEFTNWDGRYRRFNCGQAAACTFLTQYGKFEPDAEKASAFMQSVEREHPPNNLGGWLGTSRGRVERICRAFELPLEQTEGEGELRMHLRDRRPVIVMLAVPGPRVLSIPLPMGHWMVAYGFDDEHVYLTNYGSMTWPQFRARWGKLVPRLIGMRNCGLVANVNRRPK